MVLEISLISKFERKFTQIQREWSQIINQYYLRELALDSRELALKQRSKTWF